MPEENPPLYSESWGKGYDAEDKYSVKVYEDLMIWIRWQTSFIKGFERSESLKTY